MYDPELFQVQLPLLAVSTSSCLQVSIVYLNQLHAARAEENPQFCACAAHVSSFRPDTADT